MTESDNKEIFYIVVKCGYEGIDAILCPTHDPKEAADKVLSLRIPIKEAQERRKKVLEEAGQVDDGEIYPDAWEALLEEKKISYDEYSLGKYEDPDSYCVQKWDGERFACCCPEIGIEASKQWLY